MQASSRALAGARALKHGAAVVGGFVAPEHGSVVVAHKLSCLSKEGTRD